MSENRLRFETSPYLLQHQDNPVHWYPWSEEAFEVARRESKPVLLSVGYAACHWCHVMAHESFEDPETAALMNELYVNIKVDREERPDIDKIYMTALHEMGEHGGWPLTMFLDTDGGPFWGGTYFPKTSQYGRPSFKHVLSEIARIYHAEPDKVRNNTEALRQALNTRPRHDIQIGLSMEVLDTIAGRVFEIMDPHDGGLRGAPKFPQTALFELLWRAAIRTGNTDYRTSVLNTLTHICQGGIYDHLGGGWARYSVDARWLAPHFEKMLYDNAQLVELLTLVQRETGTPLFRLRIEETVAWLEREMIAEQGAFAASLDADSEGEEGKFYVWSRAEIESLLDPTDFELFARMYDVTEDGNWEGTNILNRLDHLELLDAAAERRLTQIRAKLLEHRASRVRPGWDDKVLSDWNGLMIFALANAGAAFRKPSWIALARRAFEAIADHMAGDGHLMHSLRLGQVKHFATADGYANMIRAALVLYEVTAGRDFLDQARTWATQLDTHFWDTEDGGYFFTSDRTAALIARTRSAGDDAVPNANAVMLANLARLFVMTGDETFRQRGEALLEAFESQALSSIFGHATFFNAFEFWLEPVQCILCGDPDHPRTSALAEAVLSRPIANRCLSYHDNTAELPAGHPAHGRAMIDGVPTLYLCKGTRCSLPVTDPGQLDDLKDFL